MSSTGNVTAEFVEQWRNAAYSCFSSGHKFCREVCPVMQVTRDEAHTPTAFHANVVAMEQGHLSIEDVARDYVHCTQCGACELRCPNTLFTGDFYRFRTRTVELARAMRALAVDSGIHQPNWQRWVEETVRQGSEPVLGAVPVSQEHVRDWAEGLDLAVGGETILFCDCEGAFYRTSVPWAAARILQRAGVEFGLMREQWCCGGPAAEMGYTDRAREFAEHNVSDWRAAGARRIIVFDPHDYISFTEDYPRYFGDEYDFEIVLLVDLVAELIRDGRLALTHPVERVATYHDPCRLNKQLLGECQQRPRERSEASIDLCLHRLLALDEAVPLPFAFLIPGFAVPPALAGESGFGWRVFAPRPQGACRGGTALNRGVADAGEIRRRWLGSGSVKYRPRHQLVR
jgi:heterodisulfide reductase subunit D